MGELVDSQILKSVQKPDFWDGHFWGILPERYIFRTMYFQNKYSFQQVSPKASQWLPKGAKTSPKGQQILLRPPKCLPRPPNGLPKGPKHPPKTTQLPPKISPCPPKIRRGQPWRPKRSTFRNSLNWFTPKSEVRSINSISKSRSPRSQ